MVNVSSLFTFYNSAFQITSFGCNEVRFNGWNPTFRIEGQTCHLIGPLEPADENSETFLQVYFLDTDDQVRRRTSIIDGLRPDVVLCLQDILHTNNKYVQQLKSAHKFAKGQFPLYKIIIIFSLAQEMLCYSLNVYFSSLWLMHTQR